MANNEKGLYEMNVNTRAGIKKAGGFGGRPAGRNKLYCKPYPKPALLSSLRDKLLVEIGGIVSSLHNPFISKIENEILKVLLNSTMRKLIVLQNGYCSGCGCIESKNSKNKSNG